MKRKVFSRMCFVSVIAALLSCIFIFGVLYFSFAQQMRTAVRQDALLLIDTLSANEADDASALRTQKNAMVRITLVAPSGEVLFDNTATVTENHANRPEIKAAFTSGAGEATRLSDTLQKQTYYYALRTANGNVLRTSSTIDSVFSALWACVPYVFLVVVLVSVLAMVTSRRLTQRLVAPINSIDVEHPLQNETYDELTPLLLRLEKQNQELAAQMKTVESMRDDLANIMENMAEGLIVLSQNGTVLSINHTALSILGQSRSVCLGQPLLAVHRGEVFYTLTQKLQNGENTSAELAQNNHIYEVSLSHAQHGGAILLLVDVTAKRAAEQMRREFSANVSHELKTPLQAISGFAELLQNNMVKEADKPKFIDNICTESHHLMALVQDIIHLSRLDEGGKGLPRETVDLYALAHEVAQHLQHKAQQADVTVTVSGSSACIVGVPRLLEETLYNLLDNAISYNRPGGSVEIAVQCSKTQACVTVTDSGIGIPAADKERVFERFYRVDKSHSRSSGGTGLGLSIVKHAAALHGAALSLESTEGKGTSITLTFALG